MPTDRLIQIDIGRELSQKLGRRARYVPRILVKAIERLIRQDELNDLLVRNFPRRGAEFCEGVLDTLGVKLEVKDAARLPASPRCIIASNHPLGGLDGMSMIAWLHRHYNCPVHFVVNDLLMAVDPLRDCFVPINKHGAQSRGAAKLIDEVLAGDDPVVIYPAGLVSRLGDDGKIFCGRKFPLVLPLGASALAAGHKIQLRDGASSPRALQGRGQDFYSHLRRPYCVAKPPRRPRCRCRSRPNT